MINVFEAFAGIGAQHKAISNICKKYFKVVGISEWDARAIIAYAKIHHSYITKEILKKNNLLDENKINNFLEKNTYSLDSKKSSKIVRKGLEFKKELIAAIIVTNNYSDITKLDPNVIVKKRVDLLTYSFPCQGLSIANMGRGKGIKPGSNSTSNLIWEIKRILDGIKKEKRPKYLLMENVISLSHKNHINDFNNWKKYLRNIGYETITMELNGIDFGSLQKRKRLFALSIKRNKKITEEEEEEIKEKIINSGDPIKLEERKSEYFKILTSSNKFKDEISSSIPNKTKSRIRMSKDNVELLNENDQYIFRTLTTKQDRHPNIGMIKMNNKKIEKGKHNYRFITPREAYMIMGFTSNDFDKVKPLWKKGIITKESLYRQAGNSIIVNVLEAIFKFILSIEMQKRGINV